MLRTTSRPRGLSRNADQERTNSSSGFNYILRPGAPAAFWSPKFGAVDNCIRILPAAEADGTFQPTWIQDPDNVNEQMTGDWIRRYPIVRFFGGLQGVTMLLDEPDADPREVSMTNPCWILRRAIERAIKNRQDKTGWASLVTGKMPPLSLPTDAYMVQSFLYKQNNEPQFVNSRDPNTRKAPRGARADDGVVVYGLPRSAGNALFRVMREGQNPWEHDPVDLAHGGFVHMYQLGKDPLGVVGDNNGNGTPADVFGGTSNDRGGSGGGASDNQYEVKITQTLNGRPGDIPATLGPQIALVQRKVKPWDQLLDVHTYEEQLDHLCRAFIACQDVSLRDVLMSAMQYAFSDRLGQLSDDVRYYGRTTAPTGGTVPAQQTAPTLHQPQEGLPDVGADDFFGGYAEPIDVQGQIHPMTPTGNELPVASLPTAPTMSSNDLTQDQRRQAAQRAAEEAKARALARRQQIVGASA